jgi:hypothetical protein
MLTTERRKLAEPLGSVTLIFGGLLLAFALIRIVFALTTGSGSLWGFGNVPICATQPGTYGSGAWTAAHLGVTARPGSSININWALQACASHPDIGQRALYTLTSLPAWLWGSVLFLLWRVIGAARRIGPFTPQAAAAMRRLGWLIIAGSAAAALIQGFALDELLHTMLAPTSFFNLITLPFHALLPVAALTGAALLTFARIIRVGAAMDDEIKGTV